MAQSKKELIAAIRELDDSRSVASLKKENVADLAMLLDELQPPAKVVAFRERPEVREHLDSFKENRTKLFQPAIYKTNDEELATALTTLIADLRAVAEAADVAV